MTRHSLPGQAFGRPTGIRPGSRTDYHGSEWNDDPLYNVMSRCAADHGVYTRAKQLGRSDLEARADEDLASQLMGDLLDPVMLVSDVPEAHQPIEGETLYDNGRPIYSKRSQLTWRVGGPAEWLAFWPWKAPRQPPDPIEVERSASRHAGLSEIGIGVTNPFTAETGAIHSFVDVFEDEHPINGARDRRIADRTTYLHEYLAAHADAVNVCAAEVRGHLAAQIADRRRDLSFIDAVLEGLELPFATMPDLELDDHDDTAPQGTSTVELPPPTLTDASFANIVAAIESWRITIEGGVRYLHDLGENGLSFTLLPTLQAAFGDADHGTFVHSGAADITIPARRLAAIRQRELSAEDPDVFVAEAKKGSGEELAAGAKDQLDRYLTRRTKHACLIFFITADAYEKSFELVLAGLRNHPEFDCDVDSIGTIPVLRFNDPLARIHRHVAVVGVSLPRVATQGDERARRVEARTAITGDATRPQ